MKVIIKKKIIVINTMYKKSMNIIPRIIEVRTVLLTILKVTHIHTTHNVKWEVKRQCLQKVLSTTDILATILGANLVSDWTFTHFPYHSISYTIFFFFIIIYFILTLDQLDFSIDIHFIVPFVAYTCYCIPFLSLDPFLSIGLYSRE